MRQTQDRCRTSGLVWCGVAAGWYAICSLDTPMAALNLSGDVTVDQVVQAVPALSRVFAAHGIDACCGGSATLAEAAQRSGVSLAALVDELRRQGGEIGQPQGAAPSVSSSCSTAARTAGVRPVGACAAEPNAAAEEAARAERARFVPFLVASLLFALTFGATLGACLLASLTVSVNVLSGLSLAAVRTAHGYAQVFGFATLFIMGVAYHTLPRFKATPLAAPRAASASFWLEVSGVLLVAVGFLLGGFVRSPAWLIGSLLLFAAALAFGWTIDRTLAARRDEPGGFESYLRAGCLWLIVAAALGVAAASVAGPALQPAVWDAALWGFAACWIFGMSLRILPVFMGVPPARPGVALFVVYQSAVLAWVIVTAVEAWTLMPLWRGLAGAALACAALAVVLRIGVLGPRATPGTGSDRSYEKFIVTAYVWLLAALVFAPGWTAAATAAGGDAASPLLDFGRHAFALGFLTQMIIGVATRIVPVFTGNRLWSPVSREATYYLLNGAVLARGLQVVGQVFGIGAVWPYIWLSGPLGVAAFVAFALNVFMTMRAHPAATAAAPPAYATGGPTADTLVSDLLAIPGALDFLADNGFQPLRNPAMRAALAHTVTLRQACRMHGIAVEPLVAALRELAAAQAAARAPAHAAAGGGR